MLLHRRLTRTRESTKLNRAITWVDIKARAINNKKKLKRRSCKSKRVLSTELTLDDFGGRSDALGG
jgi:hypothetical protein